MKATTIFKSFFIISFLFIGGKQAFSQTEPMNNPVLMQGSSFGNFFQQLYKQGMWDEMMRFTSQKSISKFTRKEKLIFKLGGEALRNASIIVYSTEWQRGIFEKAYKLDSKKSRIIENFCGVRDEFIAPENRTFVAGTRELKWKNIDALKRAFKLAQAEIKNKGFEEEKLAQFLSLYERNVKNIDEVKKKIQEETDIGKELIELWEKSNISHLSLTSVGIAIAASYFEQTVGEKIDIGIWIN